MSINPEPKTDNRTWVIVTILAALIGCIGALVAAFIPRLIPDLPTPNVNPIDVDSAPTNSITDSIAGNWTGTIQGITEDFSAEILVSITKNCEINQVCGTYSVPSLPCSGNLILTQIDNATFVFVEQNTGGADWCASGDFEYMELLPDNTLSWRYSDPDTSLESKAILQR